MTWDFIKPLKSVDLIEEFEKLVNYSFCESFKRCVMENNGGMPSKDGFDTDRTVGRDIQELCSFNHEDVWSIWKAYTCYDTYDSDEVELRKRYIPFASSNFGDDICFDRTNDKVVFIDHETLNIEMIANSFDDFLNCLYDDEDE